MNAPFKKEGHIFYTAGRESVRKRRPSQESVFRATNARIKKPRKILHCQAIRAFTAISLGRRVSHHQNQSKFALKKTMTGADLPTPGNSCIRGETILPLGLSAFAKKIPPCGGMH